MVNFWRATAFCTHKPWVWKFLTLSAPRREAVAFDAVASTRTRGLTTLAMSATMAPAPRALEALLGYGSNSVTRSCRHHILGCG